MKGYVFDPTRLACSPTEQERQGCELAAALLRDALGGGDAFAEVRERARRAPRLRAMLAHASELLRPHVERPPAEKAQTAPIRRTRRR